MARLIVSFHLNDAGDQVFVYSGATDEMRKLQGILAITPLDDLAHLSGEYIKAAIIEEMS